jgi:molybdopterin-containing oxidoreductase family membrane subunit
MATGDVSRADSSDSWYYVGLGIGAVMLLFLAIGLYRVFFIGHQTLANTKEVPWNIFIVNYAMSISSIGLSYIASFGIVLGMKQFDVIAKRALYLAIFIIIAGVASVAVDMRQPIHALHLILTTHPTSAIGIVAISINLYLLLIMTELFLLIKVGHHDVLVKIVAVLAFGTAIIVHSYHGAIFGLAYSRGFWNGPYYPIYFLLSALFASSSIIILVTYITYKVTNQQISEKLNATLKTIGKMLIYLLFIGLFFLYWKMTSAAYFDKPEAELLLSGPYKINFWFFEIGLGYAVPIALLAISKFENIKMMAIASLCVLIGLYIGRYDFIIVGELVPYLGFTPFESDLGGSSSALASYAPNFTEVAITVGLLGFVLTAYVLGVKYLPLDKDEK